MSVQKTELELRLSVLSPLFSSNAQQGVFALRPTTIKGLLRYWWRVLHVQSNDTEDKEGKIWGSTENAFAWNIRLDYDSRAVVQQERMSIPMRRGPVNRAYIMGLGLGKPVRGQYRNTREFLSPGSNILIRFIPRISKDKQITEIEKSLRALVLLGGIGSRARKGMGAVQLVSAKGFSSKLEALSRCGSLAQCNDILSDFKDAGLHVWESPPAFRDWEQALDYLAQHYKLYRTKGGNTTPDYRNILIPLLKENDREPKESHLAPMGLPVNFFSRNTLVDLYGRRTKRWVRMVRASMEPKESGSPGASGGGRMPAPFWITLFKQQGQYGLRLTLLPEEIRRFPDDIEVKIEREFNVPIKTPTPERVRKSVEGLAQELKLREITR